MVDNSQAGGHDQRGSYCLSVAHSGHRLLVCGVCAPARVWQVDTFPDDDIGAQNRRQRLFHLTDRPAYDHIRHLTSPWHPCEGRCLFHLLLDRLGAKGGSYESGMLQEVITNRFELFRTSDCRERRRARTQRGLGRVLVTE
jgi:hypothetical protein